MISDKIPSSTGIYETVPGCNSEVCAGTVWIFFSDVNHISQWGTISRHGMGEREKQLICNQLGYIDHYGQGNPTTSPGPPVWLTNVTCGENITNILQCNYTIDAGSDHSEDLVLECSELEA